jgi:predicted nucleic acid-binding protein
MDGVALYDANVLYPGSVRDLLVRLAVADLVTPRWTNEILDEWINALLAKQPELEPAKLERTRELMCRAVPDCLVEDFEHLIPSLELPDPDDRHVLAAAIHAKADVIVTANLRDFPAAALDPHGIVALHPDQFVHDLIHDAPEVVVTVLREQCAALRNPPQTLEDLLGRLQRNGLDQSVDAIERLPR